VYVCVCVCVCLCVCIFAAISVLNGAVHFTHQRPHVHAPVHEVALGHIPFRARRFAPFSCHATDVPYWCYFICHRHCMVSILAATLNAPGVPGKQFKPYAPPSLTLNHSTFCPHSVYILYGSQNKQRLFTYAALTAWILGALEKLRKVILSFVMSVCSSGRPSAWNIWAPTGLIF